MLELVSSFHHYRTKKKVKKGKDKRRTQQHSNSLRTMQINFVSSLGINYSLNKLVKSIVNINNALFKVVMYFIKYGTFVFFQNILNYRITDWK